MDKFFLDFAFEIFISLFPTGVAETKGPWYKEVT